MREKPSRCGQINIAWVAFLGSVGVFATLILLLFWDPFQPAGRSPTTTLTFYCASGIKAPVEAAVREYEKTYGCTVRLDYQGSQTLLSRLEVNPTGDLYLPGDDSYLVQARTKGLVAEVLPLARMHAVLAVPKGNPRQVKTLNDVIHSGLRLAMANPDAAAVGKLTRATLTKRKRWQEVEKLTVVQKGTVNDVANDVVLGTVDAGFIWDSLGSQYPGLTLIDLPELADASAHVGVGVLTSSTQPTAALHLARYLAARDRGLEQFTAHGFEVVAGDAWSERPQLLLLAGAMLRPAIEQTLDAFAQREGVEIIPKYNGCGILVSEMKTKVHPDAFFACDQSFMTQVSDLFLEPVSVSRNQLVIVVPKGNPHGIKGLDDLGKPGLRIGVGHEKQCALGALTQETLNQTRLHDSVMKNVKVQTPTGDMLVNQLLTGSLDAVVVYISNAAAERDKLEALPINIPCALATQPYAVARGSHQRYLAGRLLDSIRTQESRERFEALGFRWTEAGTKP